MPGQKKILFISHEATLTGAPIVLYRFLQWVKVSMPDTSCTILLKKSGPLEPKLKALYRVIDFDHQASLPKYIPQRIKTLFRQRAQNKMIRAIAKDNYDLIYSNSIVNGNLLHLISKACDSPVLVHVHEMELTIAEFGQKNLLQNLSHASGIIVNSKIVAGQIRKLLQQNNFDKQVDLVYPFVNPVAALEKNKNGVFTVGGSGTFTWRKGIELFLYVANAVLQNDIGVKFCWVGGDHQSLQFKRYVYLAHKLGLGDKVEFIPHVNDPHQKYSSFDLFFLSSFEEPFSLAAAECALLEVPLICLKGCSGIEELLVPDGGLAFATGDIDGIAEGIIHLLQREDVRETMGKRAKEIMLEKANVSINAPQIMSVINKWSRVSG